MKVEKQQDGGGHDAPLQEPACWRCDGGRYAAIAGKPAPTGDRVRPRV